MREPGFHLNHYPIIGIIFINKTIVKKQPRIWLWSTPIQFCLRCPWTICCIHACKTRYTKAQIRCRWQNNHQKQHITTQQLVPQLYMDDQRPTEQHHQLQLTLLCNCFCKPIMEAPEELMQIFWPNLHSVSNKVNNKKAVRHGAKVWWHNFNYYQRNIIHFCTK